MYIIRSLNIIKFFLKTRIRRSGVIDSKYKSFWKSDVLFNSENDSTKEKLSRLSVS